MAFNPNSNVSPLNSQHQGNQNQNQNRADAFLNISLPYERPDGTVSYPRLSGIPLHYSKEMEAAISQLFKEDPENAEQRLKEAMSIEFREVGQNAGGKLAI